MITRQLTTTLSHAAILVAGTIFGAWLLAAPPAGALSDAHQLLAGGSFIGEGSTLFTSPGLDNHYSINFPGTGLGENAAQMRMPGGVLSALRVKLTTATAPSSGTFSVSVRINGVDTLLTCQIAATGTCTVNANVTVANNARLAVRASNTFVGSGGMAYTYTLLFN